MRKNKIPENFHFWPKYGGPKLIFFENRNFCLALKSPENGNQNFLDSKNGKKWRNTLVLPSKVVWKVQFLVVELLWPLKNSSELTFFFSSSRPFLADFSETLRLDISRTLKATEKLRAHTLIIFSRRFRKYGLTEKVIDVLTSSF